MMENRSRLFCCGSRGSRSVQGTNFMEYGGSTSCYILKINDYALVIDCGTGMYEAGAIINDCTVIDVVFTHMHYDHILGMLSWTELPKGAEITYYASFSEWFGLSTMDEFFRAPFWPVQPGFKLKEIPVIGKPLSLRENLSVTFYNAPHPNGAKILVVRYGIEGRDEIHKIVVMFDCERSDALPVEVIENCDILLYDGMYTDEEYPSHKGFGHSTWQCGVRLASEIKCGRLIITHHDSGRKDFELRQFEEEARKSYPATDFAKARQSWNFPIDTEEKKNTGVLSGSIDVKGGLKGSINESVQKIWASLDSRLISEDSANKTVYLGCYTILMGVGAFMTVVNLLTQKTLLMYSTLLFSIFCLADILLTYGFKNREKWFMYFFEVQVLALFTFFIITGEPEGFSAVWLLMLPTAGMFILGRKNTSIVCGILFAELIFFLDTVIGQSFLMFEYTEPFKMRFPMAFAAFYLVALFLETVRQHTRNKMLKYKDAQEDIISERTMKLREQNLDLMKANSQLELRNKLLEENFGRSLTDDEVREMLKK